MVHSVLSDKSFIKVKPYQAISRIYNNMMDHVEYPMWAHYIEYLIANYNLNTDQILEIGCGTGQFARSFSYPLIGIDRYIEMLKQARNTNPEMNVFVDKMPTLAAVGENIATGMLALYDTVNYIRLKDEWLLFFKRVFSILKHEGWFIFDVVTHYCCKKYFLNDVIEERFGNDFYKRIIMYDEGHRIQHNFFYITTPEGKFFEHHQQYIPDIGWIKDQLKRAGFSHIKMFHEFTQKKPRKNSLRVHFLARKSDAD